LACFELFGGARPDDPRSQGQAGGRARGRCAEHVFSPVWWLVGLDPRGHPLGRILPRSRCGCSVKPGRRLRGFHRSHKRCVPADGHLVLSTTTDRPWSHTLLHGRRAPNFVRKHPVATKRRCGRSQGRHLCAADPESSRTRGSDRSSVYSRQRVRNLPRACAA